MKKKNDDERRARTAATCLIPPPKAKVLASTYALEFSGPDIWAGERETVPGYVSLIIAGD